MKSLQIIRLQIAPSTQLFFIIWTGTPFSVEYSGLVVSPTAQMELSDILIYTTSYTQNVSSKVK